MKGFVGGIPLALLVAAVANGYGIGQGHGHAGHEGPTTVMGGPNGDDGGNSAAVEFDSSYDTKVKDIYKDDHSFHLKNNVVAPPMPGFRKRGHGDGGHDGPTTVIAGPSGDDGGNKAAVEFDSAYSSVVDDWYKDDHSIDIKNHIIRPPPVPGFRKRGHGDAGHHGPTTVIGGPSGDDGGNSASVEFDSSYSSVVEDWYKDDHSFNEKNHIVSPPPMHGFRRRGDRGATVIGGPSGNDGGNSAEVEFDSSYASSVKDWYKDDHSIDIDNHIIHPPPMPGFRKRQGNTVIGGPSGDDLGNSAEVEFDSSYASSIKDWYKDDHSVDIDNHVIRPPPMPGFRKRQGNTVIGGPSGDDGGNSAEAEFESAYTSSVEDSYKDDHSVDIKNNIIHPPPMPGFRKRQGNTVIGGPSGNDGGNSAEVEFESAYTSSVKDSYKDDHSVDIKNNIIHPPPVYWKRDDGGNHISSAPVAGHFGKHSKHMGNALIGGPSGNDGGGSADIESENDYSSEVEDHYKDDHSVDIKNNIIHPPPVPGFRRRDHGLDQAHGDARYGGHTTLIGGPKGNDGGNSAAILFDSDYSSNVDDHYENDHSVKEENWIVQPPAHPQAPNPEPPQPVAPAPSKPCSTSTYLETIVRTIAEDPMPTQPAVPYGPSEHSQVYEPKPTAPSYPSYGYEPGAPSYPTHTPEAVPGYKPSPPSYPTHTYPAVPVYEPSSPSYPTHASEAVPSGVSPTHEPEAPKAQYDPGYSKPQPVRPPCTSSKAQTHYEPPAPSYPQQESANAHSVYSAPTTTPFPTRKPVHTSLEPLTALTSTITVSRTSSFAVVPVSVPTHRPSDVDAHQAFPSASPSHGAQTPYPTPSQGMMFTGAAGRMTSAAGVVSAVCGLMAVVAFVL